MRSSSACTTRISPARARHSRVGDGLHGVAERQRVRDRGDALDAFGDQHPVVRRCGLRMPWRCRGACSAAGCCRCGMSSPGVSMRNSIDSTTPERTGPSGRVNTPRPVTSTGPGLSLLRRAAAPAATGPPGAGPARRRGMASSSGSSRGCPTGDHTGQVVQRPFVPERRRHLGRQRRVPQRPGRVGVHGDGERVEPVGGWTSSAVSPAAVGFGGADTGRRTGRRRASAGQDLLPRHRRQRQFDDRIGWSGGGAVIAGRASGSSATPRASRLDQVSGGCDPEQQQHRDAGRPRAAPSSVLGSRALASTVAAPAGPRRGGSNSIRVVDAVSPTNASVTSTTSAAGQRRCGRRPGRRRRSGIRCGTMPNGGIADKREAPPAGTAARTRAARRSRRPNAGQLLGAELAHQHPGAHERVALGGGVRQHVQQHPGERDRRAEARPRWPGCPCARRWSRRAAV